MRVETLNPGTLTGKERWICDMMERWKVNWCTLYTGDHGMEASSEALKVDSNCFTMV